MTLCKFQFSPSFHFLFHSFRLLPTSGLNITVITANAEFHFTYSQLIFEAANLSRCCASSRLTCLVSAFSSVRRYAYLSVISLMTSTTTKYLPLIAHSPSSLLEQMQRLGSSTFAQSLDFGVSCYFCCI